MGVAWCYFVVQLLFVVVLWLALALKLADDGLALTLQHYTNWSLVWLALVLTLTLPFAVESRSSPCVNVRCARSTLSCCYLPLLQSIVFVLVAVYVLTLDDSSFLERFFSVYGVGATVVGDSVQHVWPLVVYLVFSYVHARLIFDALRRWFEPTSVHEPDSTHRTARLVVLFAHQLFALALVVFSVYLVQLAAIQSTSIQHVYSTTYSLSTVVGGLVGTGIVVNGLVLTVLVRAYGLVAPSEQTRDERLYYETHYELGSDDDKDG